MIDISKEKLLSFTEAASLIPKSPAGKKCNLVTIYRWSNQGLRGIRLEFICVGGGRCTSREALQRFFDALTAKANGQPAPELAPRYTAQRRREIKAAEQRLEKAGV